MLPVANLKSHWDNIYLSTPDDKLGWYESDPLPSLELFKKGEVRQDARILHVGAGTSTLIDRLAEDGFLHQTVCDLSGAAIQRLKSRVANKYQGITYFEEDITSPNKLALEAPFDVWHDRAVFHFLTDENDQRSYLEFLDSHLKQGGLLIMAVFSLSGADRCSGLPVRQYDSSLLVAMLGGSFELVYSFEYTYFMPSGDPRPYQYAMFVKK